MLARFIALAQLGQSRSRAKLLADKMKVNNARCVLLNTGWSGGPAGEADRISIKNTRSLLNAALDGELDDVETVRHPVFGLRMPTQCPNVESDILNPRNVWSDKGAYDQAATQLRGMFQENFNKNQFSDFGITPVM